VAAAETAFAPAVLEVPPPEWCPPAWNDEPYLLLNPVSAWKRKCYDAKKWASVLARVSDLGFTRVLLSGGGESWQREHCAEIMAKAAERGVNEVIDLSGQTSLRQYIFMVSRARAVICVDGAASHLAQAFDVPCVTLFGPSYRWLWHTPCPHHMALGGMMDSQLTPSPSQMAATEVFTALREVI
jgi:ADP-heptose:LPS heptosyltransferase